MSNNKERAHQDACQEPCYELCCPRWQGQNGEGDEPVQDEVHHEKRQPRGRGATLRVAPKIGPYLAGAGNASLKESRMHVGVLLSLCFLAGRGWLRYRPSGPPPLPR